jgi:hypothetical protein
MILIGQDDAVLEMLQSPSLAALAREHQRPEKVVAFADVFVPDGDDQRLPRLQVVGSRFKGKLFVEDRIEVSPFDACLELLSVGIGLQLAVQGNQLKLTQNREKSTHIFTNASENPFLSIASKLMHLLMTTDSARFLVL